MYYGGNAYTNRKFMQLTGSPPSCADCPILWNLADRTRMEPALSSSATPRASAIRGPGHDPAGTLTRQRSGEAGRGAGSRKPTHTLRIIRPRLEIKTSLDVFSQSVSSATLSPSSPASASSSIQLRARPWRTPSALAGAARGMVLSLPSARLCSDAANGRLLNVAVRPGIRLGFDGLGFRGTGGFASRIRLCFTASKVRPMRAATSARSVSPGGHSCTAATSSAVHGRPAIGAQAASPRSLSPTRRAAVCGSRLASCPARDRHARALPWTSAAKRPSKDSTRSGVSSFSRSSSCTSAAAGLIVACRKCRNASCAPPPSLGSTSSIGTQHAASTCLPELVRSMSGMVGGFRAHPSASHAGVHLPCHRYPIRPTWWAPAPSSRAGPPTAAVAPTRRRHTQESE